MSATITRTALRYFGGKASIADWIVSHFPRHEAYLEPFGGGASVLLRKPRAPLETYNDLSRDVVTFFAVLRDRPDDLIRAISLTPFARAEVEDARVPCADDLDDLERARRFYVVSGQTVHGAPAQGSTGSSSGWRLQRQEGGNAAMWASTSHLRLIAERLQGVQIERRDAFTALAMYPHPECLTYVDPPYPSDVRGRRWAKRAYVHEMHDDDSHRRLAAVLHATPGYVVLSGYDSPLYREMFGDWQRVSTVTLKQSHDDATECLWFNPAAASAVRQRSTPAPAPARGGLVTRQRKKPLGWCMALRGDGRRCGAPATKTYYDWLCCASCFGNAHFSSLCSVWTDPPAGSSLVQGAGE